MGWFVFHERYLCRLDGVALSAAIILCFSPSPENVALICISSLKRVSEAVET